MEQEKCSRDVTKFFFCILSFLVGNEVISVTKNVFGMFHEE